VSLDLLDAELFARLVLGATLATSGVAKLRDSAQFSQTLADYPVIPRRLANPLALALSITETILGAAAVAGLFLRVVAVASFALLAVVTAMYLTRAERPKDCGCFGKMLPEGSALGAITRNAVLAALAGSLLFVPPMQSDVPMAAVATSLVAAAGFVGLLLLSYVHLAWTTPALQNARRGSDA
jgi:uncharacterized membrane protein YphA (DoxX/SURF4 family)